MQIDGHYLDHAWEFRPLGKQRTKKFAGFDNPRVQSERFRYPTVFFLVTYAICSATVRKTVKNLEDRFFRPSL